LGPDHRRYGFDWTWTGFQGNKLWDWIDLLLVPVLLPFVLAWLATRPGDKPVHTPAARHEAEPVVAGDAARADHQSA
jgi:hypothetical protein